jgi:hypothetical protein
MVAILGGLQVEWINTDHLDRRCLFRRHHDCGGQAAPDGKRQAFNQLLVRHDLIGPRRQYAGDALQSKGVPERHSLAVRAHDRRRLHRAANKRIFGTVVQVPYPLTVDSRLIDLKESAHQQLRRQLLHRKPDRVCGPVESHISVCLASRCTKPQRKQLRLLVVIEGLGNCQGRGFHCSAPASEAYPGFGLKRGAAKGGLDGCRPR